MKLHALLGASALLTSVLAFQAAPAAAGGHHHHKSLHDAVHRGASTILCPLEWFRHRHHVAHAYTAAPKKVVYAKKVYAKKVAYTTPLK